LNKDPVNNTKVIIYADIRSK